MLSELKRAPKGAEPDPIFAAIERHRSTWAMFEATLRRYGDSDNEDPMASASETADFAAAALLNIRPTTIGGVIVLLDYAYQHESTYMDCFPDRCADYGTDQPNEFGIPFHVYLCKHAALALAAIVARDDLSCATASTIESKARKRASSCDRVRRRRLGHTRG